MEKMVLRKYESKQDVVWGRRVYTRSVYQHVNDGNDDDLHEFCAIIDGAAVKVEYMKGGWWHVDYSMDAYDYFERYRAGFQITR